MAIDNLGPIIEFEGSSEENTSGVKGYKQHKLDELTPGQTFTEKPIVNIFVNDKAKDDGSIPKYDSIRIRVVDDDAEEYLDCYANFPKPNENGVSENINKSFGFYRKAFDLIQSVLYRIDATNIVDPETGEHVVVWKKIKMQQIADYVKNLNRVQIKVTEGDKNDDYNSFKIM